MIKSKNNRKKKSLPSKEKILATWWGPLEIENRKDRLSELTHGKLSLPPCTDRCWNCGCLEDHPWYTGIGQIERCHIIPKSLGGTQDPLNFLLMCSRCHRHAPDTNDPLIMFAWMEKEFDNRQEWMRDMCEGLPKYFPEIKTEKFPECSAISTILNHLSSEKFQEYYSKNASWHFGIRDKVSTKLGTLRKYIDENKLLTTE